MQLYSFAKPNALKFAVQHIRHISAIGTLVVTLLVLLLNYEAVNNQSAQSQISRIESKLSGNETGTIVAVINTPKMGTGGLTYNFERSFNCGPEENHDDSFITFDCPDSKMVVRTHGIEGGMQAVQKHRQEHPEGKCLIVTAIRSPGPWLPSLYVQKKRVCENISMTKEEMLQDYKEWLSNVDVIEKTIEKTVESCLPGLLQEFNGGSLVDQAKILDRNNGYSILDSTSSDSIFAGCELLLLRMEQNDQWPEIIDMVVPGNKFYKGESRASQCPELVDHIKMLHEYELTKEEKMAIYTDGGASIADWFDAYGYTKGG